MVLTLLWLPRNPKLIFLLEGVAGYLRQNSWVASSHIMITTNEEFCNEWFDNTLGKKAQHGSYYNQKFKDAEFLCYFNSVGKEGPYVIAMRCFKTGVLLLDDENISRSTPDEFYLGRKGNIGIGCYITSFRRMNNQSEDLAEIKAIDWVVKDTPAGKLHLVLYDVNGYKFYTDLGESLLIQSRAEFLDHSNLEHLPVGAILKMGWRNKA